MLSYMLFPPHKHSVTNSLHHSMVLPDIQFDAISVADQIRIPHQLQICVHKYKMCLAEAITCA